MTSDTEVPIACTLTAGTYQQRLDWIAQLTRDGLRSHQRNELILELRYASEVADRVRELVRKEDQCCAFLTFELSEENGDILLTITVPERARDAADLLFAPFLPSAASGSRNTVASHSLDMVHPLRSP
jgi:hypothetical protein